MDSSAWYAAADSGDRNHEAAKKVLGGEDSLTTTDVVLIETWLLISRRIGYEAAERFWTGLRDGVASVEQVASADFDKAWLIGEAFADAGFSIVDRTSFAVMQRLRMSTVAAFDYHFDIYRYGQNRDRAFTAVSYTHLTLPTTPYV